MNNEIEWDVTQAAQFLGISRQLVVHHVKQGEMFNFRYIGDKAEAILIDKGYGKPKRRQIVITEPLYRMKELRNYFKQHRYGNTKASVPKVQRISPFGQS